MQRKTFEIKPDFKKMLEIGEGNLLYRGKKRAELSVRSTDMNHGLVPYITYRIYEPYAADLLHGFTTRYGGVSKEHLASLNLSFSRGDDPENVKENYERLGKAMGFDPAKAVFSDQVHKTRIKKVTAEDAGKGITRESDIKETDGLMTNVPGIPLFTFFADCVPVYFYDPVHKSIGLAHSGWKGTVGNIVKVMATAMREAYGSAPEDLICAIGPSICQTCYEVSEDVAQQFMDAYDEDLHKELFVEKGGGKYLLDLHAAVRYNLLSAGVLFEHIAMPDLCTCCNPKLLYSHRASKGMRGNMAAVMMLREEDNK